MVETVKQGNLGRFNLRLVRTKTGYGGVVNSDKGQVARIEGPDPDALWRLLEKEAARACNEFFGYEGARLRFLSFFPGGFATPRYVDNERGYKMRAKAMLDSDLPLDGTFTHPNTGYRAADAYLATNLLHPQFEKARVVDLLRSETGAAFVQAAACFTNTESQEALLEMAQIAKRFDCAKWTVLTYLPFLWRPDRHMFLKPEVTKRFAERVGHPFHLVYEAAPNINVYRSLLDLADETEREIAAFGNRDRIDVQSFIWVVGEYRDTDRPLDFLAETERKFLSEAVLRQLAHDRIWNGDADGFEQLVQVWPAPSDPSDPPDT